jgi:hypothetical protein
MDCPNCRSAMAAHALEGRLGRSVTIDLCAACQAFWFDERESLQLTPGATLTLFRIVGEHVSERRGSVTDGARCPRCGAALALTHDRQRNTAFQYFRCRDGHGRLTTFYDFLREKDFIRPLSREQLAELRRNIQFVNCSNCGAPIDLAKASACSHCGSPISMLDVKQTEDLIARLREADRPDRAVDPTLPLRLARARREVEASFATLQGDSVWLSDAATSGLVGAGLHALARWLRQGV